MILSRDNQAHMLEWAAIEKGDAWWPDATAFGIYHETTKPHNLVAVIVLEKIGRHTADSHIKSNGKRHWASRRIIKGLYTIAFDAMGLNRLEARIGATNADSLRLCGKLGYKVEGLLKDGHGPGKDAILCAVTRKDCRWFDLPAG
jgi:RimJ/RimL family protein N-acetyltransferase